MRRDPSFDEALWAQAALIERFGGTLGLRDAGALQAALLRPQAGCYADLIDEAAALMESLAMNHPLKDGNKRVAIFVTYAFLRMNGQRLDLDEKAAFDYLAGLFDANRFRRDELRPWLAAHAHPAERT